MLKAIVNDDAVLARLGDRGVGENALIVGVLLDRAHGRTFEFVDLLPQHSRHVGSPALEFIEALYQPLAGGFSVALRLAKQADGEVGEPVAVFAEIVADALGDVDELGSSAFRVTACEPSDNFDVRNTSTPGSLRSGCPTATTAGS